MPASPPDPEAPTPVVATGDRRLARRTRGRPLRIVVIGSLKNVPSSPDLSKKYVDALGEVVVSRGHTLMTGCRGSLDRAIAKVANRHGQAGQLVSFYAGDSLPSHNFGLTIQSEVSDWEMIARADARPPEQIARSDVTICVAGSAGTLTGATWARFAEKPVLGVACFGGAGQALYRSERDHLGQRPWGRIGLDRFEVLGRVTADVRSLAEDTVDLAEDIVIPPSAFVIMSFQHEFDELWKVIDRAVRAAGFDPIRTDLSQATERVIPLIHHGIARAAFVVADVTTASPNVLYELGYALALDRPVVVTVKKGTSLPFDVNDLNAMTWDDTADAETKLPGWIDKVLQRDSKHRD